MANSTLMCRHCKKRKPREEALKINGGNYCDLDCATAYGRDKGLKAKQVEFKKTTAKMKRKLNDSDLKVRKAAARKACHDYIKARDKGQGCICCGEPLGELFHAGHFYTDGNHPMLRYHEDNIHGQRVDCNYFKGGDSGQYRPRLIEKIGADRVAWLDENKSKPIKRTAQDYKEIERHYKDKLKQLKGRVNERSNSKSRNAT